ncbi:MAG: uroporphyrinogen decarboxylase family protein [Clostridia bacterium]|nr:uroporphyrinogen decarboxylase family protein [Clostridia bacterium]
MKEKAKALLKNKQKTVPILSFPSASLMGISVKELISSSENLYMGMKTIKEKCPIGAGLNMMDLSVEAEAFGAKVRFYEKEIPAVEKGIIESVSEAEQITVPKVGAGRTALYIESVRKAKENIKDIPVFAGVIGPYSLAGRLFDMTELMMECYDSPDEVKILLSKASLFLKEYINAFKEAGADGIIMAEPAAGLLSPALNREFSLPFVKEIFDDVNQDDFLICYHNCGNAANDMLTDISTLNADIFHFGNAIDLKKALDTIPSDKIVMGNIDPVMFLRGKPEDIENEVERLHRLYSGYDNFMISTGCDVPPEASWENIEAYFNKVTEIYV